jgi:hypothetical protein
MLVRCLIAGVPLKAPEDIPRQGSISIRRWEVRFTPGTGRRMAGDVRTALGRYCRKSRRSRDQTQEDATSARIFFEYSVNFGI